jgi:predicted transcriptional regulator
MVALIEMEDYKKDFLSSGRRCKLEIMASIVAQTQKPKKITILLGHVNISYRMLKIYIKFMIEKHLIEKRKIEKTKKEIIQVYQATERVKRFLKSYCEILKVIYEEDFHKNKNSLAVFGNRFSSILQRALYLEPQRG